MACTYICSFRKHAEVVVFFDVSYDFSRIFRRRLLFNLLKLSQAQVPILQSRATYNANAVKIYNTTSSLVRFD
jgi:hypothetical protein